MRTLEKRLDFSLWFTARVLITVLAFVVMAIWGFYTSLAGRPLWKDEFLD